MDDPMRKAILTLFSLALVFACAFLSASSQTDPVKVRLRLIDTATGKSIGGIVRVVQKDGGPAVELPGLYPRLRGLKVPDSVDGWQGVPAGGAATPLPRGAFKLDALSGLEPAVTKIDVDLRKAPPDEIVIKLEPVFRPEQHGLAAGNTHLHLMKLTPEDA